MKGKRKERGGTERKGEKESIGKKREKGKGKKERQGKGGFVAVSTIIHIIHNTISFFTSIYILFSFLLIIMGICEKEDSSLNNGFKNDFSVAQSSLAELDI